MFEEPVTIFIGLNFATKIRSVGQAHALLTDWPARQRCRVHARALAACRAALTGELAVEEARRALTDFLARAGLQAQNDHHRGGTMARSSGSVPLGRVVLASTHGSLSASSATGGWTARLSG